MGNIARKALELLSDLARSGAKPTDYLDRLSAHTMMKPEDSFSDYRMGDLYADITGFKDVTDPELRKALLDYSGSYSQDYSEPYRLSRAALAEKIGREQDYWMRIRDKYQANADDPYLTASDREYFKGLLKDVNSKLAKISEAPFRGRGSKAAQLLRAFYPAPQDFTVYRGLNPSSKTARRLAELEQRYGLAQEGFGEGPDYVRPTPMTDYGNRGYLSTSMDKNTARSFGDWSATEGDNIGYDTNLPSRQLYKILVPEGTPIRPLLNRLSDNPSEAEVLLPPMSIYEKLGERADDGFMPIMWVGRGKPVSDRYIGAMIPGGLGMAEYLGDDE